MLARLRGIARDIFHRTGMERDMAVELRFHLEERIEDLVRQGIQPEDAAQRAKLEFGSSEAYKEQCREARGLRFFDEARQDLRYGHRHGRERRSWNWIVVDNGRELTGCRKRRTRQQETVFKAFQARTESAMLGAHG